ncbi:MAG: hypothetical protein US61_C0003G0015 [Parcubacteria group bacterium GW2011_GWE2_37_8]|nr:MAG: hypothetical protein US61_C0003G0015 [Parcubacteria group bacterium GW2011_GWE2_37_8]KKQ59313.1 MAG: hypothetical protein US78_C0006G0020 [Parcubacteria group bacterium GW2011_GWD1_38_16]
MIIDSLINMSRSSHIPKGKKIKKQVEKFGPVRFPERRGKQEFGAGAKEYLICKDCQAAYYDKSWHESLADYKHLKEKNIDKKKINFILCPACQMIKNNQYEGIVLVYNTPEKIKKELMNLAENMGKTARSIDPLDRVSKIKETKNTIEIWTTENQLAKKIANKLKATFPNQLGEKKIHFSGEGSDVVRITVG